MSWNTAGPQGAPGPAGPQGTSGARGLTGLTGNTGDPGARGPSDAYIATAAGATTTGPESVTVVVPAGDYSAWAQALVSGTYSNPALGQCTLDATGQGSSAHSYESKGYVPAQFGTEPGEVELPAATVFHLPSGGTIRYDCQGSTTSYATLSLTWSNLQITATQVGTEHG